MNANNFLILPSRFVQRYRGLSKDKELIDMDKADLKTSARRADVVHGASRAHRNPFYAAQLVLPRHKLIEDPENAVISGKNSQCFKPGFTEWIGGFLNSGLDFARWIKQQ